MLLYHGSNMSVEQPKIRKLRAMDFGFGFYLTSNEKQAAQFAEKVAIREERLNSSPGIPTVNVYECSFEEAMLAINVLKFEAPDEKWLDFVVANRMGKNTEKDYDIIMGPVANDDVFEVIRIYEAGAITKEMALAAMKIKKLFNQYVLKTERGLSLLQFMNAYEVKQ